MNDRTQGRAYPAGRAPLTTRERLEGIEQMCKRVNEHVEFMRGVDALGGTSAEAKEAAVADFYARMAALERQLGQISEGLRLG
jgi:hypothetical protein